MESLQRGELGLWQAVLDVEGDVVANQSLALAVPVKDSAEVFARHIELRRRESVRDSFGLACYFVTCHGLRTTRRF